MTEFRFENACPEGCYVLCRPLGCSLETPFLDEFEQVAHAIEKRQREFLQTRNLARELMSLLGVPAQPILAEPDRAPRWPTGLVGSLTHNDTHGAVSLARSGTLHSVGLDIETQGRIRDRTKEHLAHSDIVIAAVTRTLLDSIKMVEEGKEPPGRIHDPDKARPSDFICAAVHVEDDEDGPGYCRKALGAQAVAE